MPIAEEAEEAAARAAADLADVMGVKVLTKAMPKSAAKLDGKDFAGVYELACMSWDEPYVVLTPHPVTGQLVQTHHTKRHRRGDLVSLSDREARRLLRADAVIVPGTREAIEARRIEKLLEAQRAGLQAATERKKAAAAVLGADLTDQQRALAELALDHALPPTGQSVAPGTEED